MSEPSNQRELEIKIALPDESTYERLAGRLAPPRAAVDQQNIFLDTPDRHLGARGWALRIRREDDADHLGARLLITAKGPSRNLAGAVDRPEIEAEAPIALWDAVQAPEIPCASLASLPLEHLQNTLGLTGNLVPILAFANRRTTFELPLGGRRRPLSLDRTSYPTGEVDFEIEVELEVPANAPPALAALDVKAVEADLRRLLGEAGIEPLPPRPGKFARGLAYAGR